MDFIKVLNSTTLEKDRDILQINLQKTWWRCLYCGKLFPTSKSHLRSCPQKPKWVDNVSKKLSKPSLQVWNVKSVQPLKLQLPLEPVNVKELDVNDVNQIQYLQLLPKEPLQIHPKPSPKSVQAQLPLNPVPIQVDWSKSQPLKPQLPLEPVNIEELDAKQTQYPQLLPKESVQLNPKPSPKSAQLPLSPVPIQVDWSKSQPLKLASSETGLSEVNYSPNIEEYSSQESGVQVFIAIDDY